MPTDDKNDDNKGKEPEKEKQKETKANNNSDDGNKDRKPEEKSKEAETKNKTDGDGKEEKQKENKEEGDDKVSDSINNNSSRWRRTFHRLTRNKTAPGEDSESPAKPRRESTLKSIVQEVDPFLERFAGMQSRGESVTRTTQFKEVFSRQFWLELVFDPGNDAYYYWMFIVTMSVMYNLIFIIARAVFFEELSPHPAWFFFDYLCDALYLFDMFVKSRKGFLEQGLLVRDTSRLRAVYIRSPSFYIDIFAVLPLDILYIVAGVNSLLRFNRLVKVYRLLEFFQVSETHTAFPNFFRLCNLVLYILIIIHWNACFYYAISRELGFRTDDWTYPGRNNTESIYERAGMKYLYSFYWSTLTLTTIGDTPFPEREEAFVFCIFDSLTGVLIFATIFGNIGAMINNMNAARTEFQAKIDAVKHYMELRSVGGELQTRVIKWFDYTWNNKQSTDDKTTLMILPEKLRAEIAIQVHLGTLRRVNIFKDCEPGLLVELVLKLRLQVFSPGDYVCQKGDIGKEMYIIKSGKLEVVSPDGKIVFVTLGAGAVFGEISVLNIKGNKTGNRRTASVRSAGYSDLFCLSKDDLLDALQEYPEARKVLSEKGKQMLRKDNLLDEEKAKLEERKSEALATKIDTIMDSLESLQTCMSKVVNKIGSMETDMAEKLSQISQTTGKKTGARETGTLRKVQPTQTSDSSEQKQKSDDKQNGEGQTDSTKQDAQSSNSSPKAQKLPSGKSPRPNTPDKDGPNVPSK